MKQYYWFTIFAAMLLAINNTILSFVFRSGSLFFFGSILLYFIAIVGVITVILFRKEQRTHEDKP
jgi:hypothetical protein